MKRTRASTYILSFLFVAFAGGFTPAFAANDSGFCSLEPVGCSSCGCSSESKCGEDCDCGADSKCGEDCKCGNKE